MNDRINTLDALRGIAAVSVVLFHYFSLTQLTFFNIGCTGVDLFFIISGFIIFYSIQKKISPSNFLLKRFIRLYPVYWFVLILTSIVFSIEGFILYDNFFRINLKTFLGNLTMLQSYFHITNIDGPYWTLTVELTFYFLIAITLIKGQIFLIKYGYLLLIVPLLIYIFEDYDFIKDLSLRFKFLVYIPLFYSGIIFYIVYKSKMNFKLFIILLICYLIQILLFKDFYKNSDAINFTEYSITLFCIYGLFFLFVVDKLNFITHKYLLFFGKISYSLYLVHNYIGTVIIINLSKFINQYLSIAITFVFITILSYYIYTYVEINFSKKIKLLLTKK